MYKKHRLIIFIFLLVISAGTANGVEISELKTALDKWDIYKAGEVLSSLKKDASTDRFNLHILEAEYLYKRSRFFEAVNVLKELESNDASIQGQIAFLNDMDKITNKFLKIESEHFIVRYHPDDAILEKYIVEALEKSFDYYKKIFGIDIQEKIPVEIYPSAEDFNIASTLSKHDMEVSHAVAICKYNRLMMITPRAFRYGFRYRDTIAHELVHYFIQRKTDANCPIWLHEGTADYLDSKWHSTNNEFLSPSKKNLLEDIIKSGEYITFDRMEPSLVKLSSVIEVEKAFAEVSLAVDMVYNRYGSDTLQMIFDELKTGKNIKTVLKDIFGMSLEDFEKAWLEYLKTYPLSYTDGAKPEPLLLKEGSEASLETPQDDVSVTNRLKVAKRFDDKQRYNIAEQEYKKILENEPHHFETLALLGRLYQKSGRFPESITTFKHLERIRPDFTPLYTRTGRMLYDRGDIAESIRYLSEANELNPYDPEIHRLLSDAYKEMGDGRNSAREQAAYLLLVGKSL